jgi:hypothetical protein
MRAQHTMKSTTALVLALISIPAIASAQPQQPDGSRAPEGQRSMQEMDRAMRFRGMVPGGGYGPGGATTRPWRMYTPNPSPEEWKLVSEFMQKELPNSWALFDKIPENSFRRDEARRKVYQRYLDLHKDKETPMFPFKLDQARISDQILGLLPKLREADDADRPALESQLRELVKTKIQSELKERQLRIDSLAKKLDKEKQQLAMDQETLEKHLDERVKSLIQGGPGSKRDNDRPRREGPAEGRAVGAAE